MILAAIDEHTLMCGQELTSESDEKNGIFPKPSGPVEV